MFNRLKLKGKLLLSFLLVVVISTATTTTYSIFFFSEKIKTSALENMQRDIQIAESQFRKKITEIEEITDFIAKDSHLQGLVYFVIQDKLAEYLQKVILREGVHQIAVIDPEGQPLSAVVATDFYPEDIAINYPQNQLLQKVRTEERTLATLERVQTSKGDMLALTAASPIFKKTLRQEVVALILVRYLLNEDVRLVTAIQQLIGITTALYQCGQVISFSQSLADPRISPAIYHRLMTEVTHYEEVELRQEGQLAEYKTLYDFNHQAIGVLGVHVSANQYVDMIYEAVIRLIVIMVVCIIASFILAYLLARGILVPISRLLNGVTQITSGDLSYKIQIHAEDELGVLARSFNGMAKQLGEFFQVFKDTIDTLTRAGTALSSEKNLDELLEMLVTEARSICNADEGILYILENNALQIRIIQNKTLDLYRIDELGEHFQWSAIALDKAQSYPCVQSLLTKQIILIADTSKEESYNLTIIEHHDEMTSYKTRQVLIVPLLDRMGDAVGLLKLANPLGLQNTIGEFTPNEIEIVNSLASQAAVAIENARVHEQIERKNRAFEKFVPVQFLRHLGKREIEEINLGDASQEQMSVLFSDIRAFTTLSETMSPEENFHFLNNYLKFIGPCITRYQGFIDKFIGDGIMALFSGHCISMADDALMAALGMLEQLAAFNRDRQHSRKLPINIGIGIHTGPLTLGTIGFASRIETTVIGDTVNLASRIESLTKHYGITLGITSTTLQHLKSKEGLYVREVDTVQVKGKEEAMTVYDIFNADKPLIRDSKLQTLERYHLALTYYKQGDWDNALCLFRELEKSMIHDRVIQIYLQRCHIFKANPPGQEWMGITRLEEK